MNIKHKVVSVVLLITSSLIGGSITPLGDTYQSNSPIGEYNVDPDKSTTGAKGDNGVYKGYNNQVTTAVLPATVKTTTTHTTNYRYVAPPPPPPPSGGGGGGGGVVDTSLSTPFSYAWNDRSRRLSGSKRTTGVFLPPHGIFTIVVWDAPEFVITASPCGPYPKVYKGTGSITLCGGSVFSFSSEWYGGSRQYRRWVFRWVKR